MIKFDQVKAINNAPNIIMRAGDKWTNMAQKKGLKYKGVEYLMCTVSEETYFDCLAYGGKDFWTKNDAYNAMHYYENEKDIQEWLKNERHKDSILGR